MSSSLWWMFDIPHTLYIKVKVNKGFIQISLSSSLCQRPQDQWITAWDYFITASVGSLGSLLWMIKMGLSKGLWEDYGTSRRPEEQSLKLSIKKTLSTTTPQNWPRMEAAASIPAPLLPPLCPEHTFSSSARGQREPLPCQENTPFRKTLPTAPLWKRYPSQVLCPR